MSGGNVGTSEARPLSIILDADGVTKLARRDRRVRLMLDHLTTVQDTVMIVPLVGVVQALAHGSGERAIERLVRTSLDSVGLDMMRARIAAHLLRDSGTTDVADALICGEALMRVPSVLITSDPIDMRRLLDEDSRGPRVAVWSV
jgi:hypothetical protein